MPRHKKNKLLSKLAVAVCDSIRCQPEFTGQASSRFVADPFEFDDVVDVSVFSDINLRRYVQHELP